MDTQSALTRFYKHMKELGRSPKTRDNYNARLRHFALEHPELPTDNPTIEQFLRKRGETPAHRGMVFKTLQAFYSYLEQEEGIPSPVPPKGPMGRPRKHGRVVTAHSAALQVYPPASDSKVVQGGRYVSSSTYIFTQTAVEAFMARRRAMGCKPKTLQEYRYFFRMFANMFTAVPLTPQKLDKFLDNPEWSQTTKWDAWKNLSAFYHFLVEYKFLPEGLIKVPKVARDPEDDHPRVLSREELLSLWAHVRSFQEKCILSALIDTKCRRSELLSMTRENIFEDHALVTGKKGSREVPLTNDTYVLLCQLASSGPLFTLEGRLMRGDYLRLMMRDLMRRAGLTGDKLGPQILRHSASVQHILAGGSERLLQEELGHTTPLMTAHYSRLANVQVRTKHQELNLVAGLSPEKPLGSAVVNEKTSSPPRSGVTFRALSLDEAMEKLKGG